MVYLMVWNWPEAHPNLYLLGVPLGSTEIFQAFPHEQIESHPSPPSSLPRVVAASDQLFNSNNKTDSFVLILKIS